MPARARRDASGGLDASTTGVVGLRLPQIPEIPKRAMQGLRLILCIVIAVAAALVGCVFLRGSAAPARGGGAEAATLILTYDHVSSIPTHKIRMWRKLEPDLRLLLFGDAECLQFLGQHCGDWATALFRALPYGPIRSDLFRAASIYYLGGSYADVDLLALSPLARHCPAGVLSTVQSALPDEVNTMYMRAPARHWILARVLERYREAFAQCQGDIFDGCGNSEDCYWAWSIGVQVRHIMTQADRPGFVVAHHPWVREETGLRLPFEELDDFNTVVLTGTDRVVMKNRSDDYDPHLHKFKT